MQIPGTISPELSRNGSVDEGVFKCDDVDIGDNDELEFKMDEDEQSWSKLHLVKTCTSSSYVFHPSNQIRNFNYIILLINCYNIIFI